MIEHDGPIEPTVLVELAPTAALPQQDFRFAAKMAMTLAGLNNVIAGQAQTIEAQRRSILLLTEAHDLHRDRAETDLLTGLRTQRAYKEEFPNLVKHAQTEGETLAALFIDLDNFKLVNDVLGHDKGDELLRAVGERILGIIRAMDYAWRDGGDEFKLALPNFGHERNYTETELNERLNRVARKVQSTINSAIADHEIPIELAAGASVGAGLLKPGEDHIEFMKRVEESMYSDKRKRRQTNGFSLTRVADSIRNYGAVIL